MRATNLTALLAGAWCGTGMTLLQVLKEKHLLVDPGTAIVSGILLVLIFLPGWLFVFGRKRQLDQERQAGRETMKGRGRVGLRMAVWFGSFVLFGYSSLLIARSISG
jgi:hypothetical protein